MSEDFDYFFWALPNKDFPLFALYDVFDNHLMMLSYSHDYLFLIRKLVRSKTMLEIVELTNVPNIVENRLLDNSVVEHWGLSNPLNEMFDDLKPKLQKNIDADVYYAEATFKTPELIQVNSNFDNFKRDLQKQIFFMHYCVQYSPPDTVLLELQRAVELGIDYQDTVDRFLNLTHIKDKRALEETISFLRLTNLFYE